MFLLPLLTLLACSGDPSSADTAAAGTGTVSGSFEGRAFDTVGAAWRIGEPDDPAQTMVIYVFDNPISCADIVDPAWDERVMDQTQSVEMKVVGTEPGDYPLSEGRTPGPGESDVNYTLTSTSGTPGETAADSGMVVIDTLEDDGASGTFDLTFPSGDTLSGSFDASPCLPGHEP